MKKRLVIISAIVLAVVIATIILILTLGGKNENNTSSDIDTNSSEIVSSSDESSSETETSSDEENSKTSSEVNSSQTSTPNKTESSSTPTTSTNKTESKSETTSTPTTTPATPTTYFEKHNLKLSPLTTNVCFNIEAGHKCALEKHTKITVGDMNNYPDNDFAYEAEQGGINVSEYKYIEFEIYDGWFDEGYSDCGIDPMGIYFFDKYTGTYFMNAKWQEISHNGKTYKIAVYPWGFGGGMTNYIAFCPKDYDGLIVSATAIRDNDNLTDDKVHTFDEVIDLKNDKYYLFAAN